MCVRARACARVFIIISILKWVFGQGQSSPKMRGVIMMSVRTLRGPPGGVCGRDTLGAVGAGARRWPRAKRLREEINHTGPLVRFALVTHEALLFIPKSILSVK